MIDGEAQRSCLVPVNKAAGHAIVTVEGLGTPAKPSPLQQAFIDLQAAQCGYCVAGMVMTAHGAARAASRRRPRTLYGRARRQPLPLRHAPANSAGGPARDRKDDGMSRISRREFLQTGAALVVSFSLPGVASAQRSAHGDAAIGKTLATGEVDGFVAVNADGSVTIYSGKVDLGQGLRIAIPQMAAEELSLDVSRITLIEGDTALTPDQGADRRQLRHHARRSRDPPRGGDRARGADRARRRAHAASGGRPHRDRRTGPGERRQRRHRLCGAAAGRARSR